MKKRDRWILPLGAMLALMIASRGDAQVGRNLGLLEPNLVTKEQLVTVPGVDAALADAIIQGRPYLDNLALDKVLATKLSAEQRSGRSASVCQ